MKSVFEVIEAHDMQQLLHYLDNGGSAAEPHPEDATWYPIIAAIDEIDAGCSIDALMILLQSGASPNPPDSHTTPLLTAVGFQLMEVVRLLQVAGANPNIKDLEGESPLQRAVCMENLPMASLLLAGGAASSIDDSTGIAGMSALSFAVARLNIPMIKLLIDAGANPSKPDVDGLNAQDYLHSRNSTNAKSWDLAKELLTTHGKVNKDRN